MHSFTVVYHTVFIPLWHYTVAAAAFLYHFAYVWLPFVLFAMFFKIWLNYVRLHFMDTQEKFLIEIKLPREITKTPLAMETFLTAIWQKAPSTYIDTYWDGKVEPWYSLEIVSLGGQIKFYIWGLAKYKPIVEAQLYAQYPDIHISDAEDYTGAVVYDLDKTFVWGTYFKLTGKDVYPIKTYVDYGMDRAEVEEEYKIDPMTALLEFLGSIKPTDQLWMQILIQGHSPRRLAQGHIFPTKDWTKEAKQEIAAILKEAGVGVEGKFPFLSKAQEEKMKAIDRSVGKFAYDTVIRAFYISPADKVDTSAIPGLIGSLKQFSSNNLNGFKLGWFTDFDYPWMDYKRIRRTSAEKRMLRAYKLRSVYQLPYKHFHTTPFILTTEELATIYHFPGAVARTPSLQRIESRRSEAPTNLPV